MKKVENDFDIIIEAMQSFNPPLPGTDSLFREKVIIDVGCGTGGLVRALAAKGARVFGIDQETMIAKAGAEPLASDETYIIGGAQELPFDDGSADVIIYFASFHHVPKELMNRAMNHCRRVLKKGGIVIFGEPVGRDRSYYELVKLVEEERDIQAHAYEIIQNADSESLEHKSEELIYFERSYDDFLNILNIFVEDEADRNRFKEESIITTERMAQEAGIPFEDFRFKSICRINVLQRM